jgi:hypothetical protein
VEVLRDIVVLVCLSFGSDIFSFLSFSVSLLWLRELHELHLVMERRFSVEAKVFSFSVKIDEFEFRLKERRKEFIGNIFLGIYCSVWFKDTVEEAVKDLGIEDFVKSFRKDVKVLMVRGGGNKLGRYLEVGAFAEGGHKGVIWLPEGCQGWG